jgi:putative tricarboxylic transport membrane protein
MDKRKDLAVAVAIALLGLAIAILGTQVNLGRVRDPVGARALPIAVGVMICVGGLFLAGRRLVRWSRDATIIAAEGTEDEPSVPGSTLRAVSVWALCFAYAALLSRVGFLIGTPVLLAVLLWIMGVRRPLRLGLVTVLAVAVIFAIFDLVFGVRLPLGPLEPYLG